MPLPRDFFSDILSQLKIFSNLDPTSLYNLSQHFEELSFKKDEKIFEEGSDGDAMMVIASGEVRISYKVDIQESEEALAILKTGDVFGEMALLDKQPRSATAIAHSNVIILSIRRDIFLKFLESYPKPGVHIMLKISGILSQRLRESDNKIKSFISLSKWI
jgi:CRP-like cAMP-binding protein